MTSEFWQDYLIFENGLQKIDCYVGIRLAWHGNSGSLLIFEEKWFNNVTVPKSAPNSHSLWVHRLLNDDVWIFWAPNARILLIDLIDLLPKQAKMYWKIGLIEWGTIRPAVAVIWMMLCFILKWKGLIFLIKPYFWKTIHKFFFYSRFKFQMLNDPPCIVTARIIQSLWESTVVTIVFEPHLSESKWTFFIKYF